MKALAILIALTATAWAHKPSDAHLALAADGAHITGRLDVAVRDLDGALQIDDGDGHITWVSSRPRRRGSPTTCARGWRSTAARSSSAPRSS